MRGGWKVTRPQVELSQTMPATSLQVCQIAKAFDRIHAISWEELRRNLAGMTFFVAFS
jgi:hypothetical protein